MIRGAIDYHDAERVSGWVHSHEIDLKGRTLLAFVDRVCVGAGVVGGFRQDLADAGVGDGHTGFNFTISPSDMNILNRVEVRFEGSDFALLPADATLAGTAANSDRTDSGLAIRPERIHWMRERGWIDQTEVDFLRQMSKFGYYDCTLRQKDGGRADPAAVADSLLSLVAEEPVKVVSREIPLGCLAYKKDELLGDLFHPMVAVSSEAGSVDVIEGSHLRTDGGEEDPRQFGVRTRLSGNGLLLINLLTNFAVSEEGATATVFLATRSG